MTTTLMVVDDSKSSRKVNVALVRELLGDNVECIEATGGEDALAQLAKRAVDLLLLDLTMPGVSDSTGTSRTPSAIPRSRASSCCFSAVCSVGGSRSSKWIEP